MDTTAETKINHRKRSGFSHVFATDDGWLIMSNGFDYNFYKYTLVGEKDDRQDLVLEKNLAYYSELSIPNEFPLLEQRVDPYDNQISFKWNLKDELFLRPARLFPRCSHLLTYACQTHVTSMVKKAVLEYSVQTCYFLLYSNELTLAAALIDKIDNLQYDLLATPIRTYHYGTLLDSCGFLSKLVYRNDARDRLILENYGSSALRIALIFKCFSM